MGGVVAQDPSTKLTANERRQAAMTYTAETGHGRNTRAATRQFKLLYQARPLPYPTTLPQPSLSCQTGPRNLSQPCWTSLTPAQDVWFAREVIACRNAMVAEFTIAIKCACSRNKYS